MTGTKGFGKYYKFIVYLVIIILVNVVGLSLFKRADLTSEGVYSLSEASKAAVKTLSEPLTINVFFTKNLPAPHNNTERYLHDLLEEYSVNSNKYFNYRFFDVSAEEGDIGEEAKRNQEMARNYGIYPVQIQNIEQDEVKFQNAYMGMVMIHGDVIDKLPAITSTEGLEYTITSKIEKLNNKISALVRLEEPVQVKLFFSSSLEDVAPQLRMDGLMQIPSRIESIVDGLSDKYYGKIAYTRLDPTTDQSLNERISRYNILTLRWQSMKDNAGNEVVPAGTASAGIVVEWGGKFESLPLIRVINMPLFGTQYQLADLDGMEEQLGEMVDDVIDINKKIGYLSDHGTPSIAQMPQLPNMPQQQEALGNFNGLLSETYSISNVQLKDGEIPEGIDCLIIAGPREPLSDYALFQIDQFLMKGKSLAIFLDPFEEIMPSQDQMYNQYNRGPMYQPINSGLEKLLNHYGVGVKKSYILDKNCFEQRLPQMYGGGKREIYYAPIIKNEKINRDLPFMNNIKALITLKSSPVELKSDVVESWGLDGATVFSSSDESWEMSGRIDLNPWSMQPPTDPGAMESYPLAVLLEGEFPSYFAGKEIPEKPVGEEPENAGEGEESGAEKEVAAREKPAMDEITDEGAIIERGRPGKLFVIGTAEILRDNVIDEEGKSTSSTFVMNLLDHLNGRTAYAAMRSKMQQYNPLRETTAGIKTFVKSLNIAGLPVIVVLFGVVVWMRRAARKRSIEMMFRE
ncbi:MAG TPA: Gldg family protein [Patescibacteria group bacterium]|nr:Gldg family protein [Patescibacteria group bacterium]